jgi:membrane-associated phospholipid phosphatase
MTNSITGGTYDELKYRSGQRHRNDRNCRRSCCTVCVSCGFPSDDGASTRAHEGSKILCLPFRLRPFSAGLLLIPGFFLIPITDCGTLENGRGWGQDALYPVDGKRVSKALFSAATDWGTLIPAGGAIVSSFDSFDARVNSWATSHTPIFGSINSASRASDYLEGILQAEVLVTALATPSGEDPKEWVSSKAKGLSVEVGADLVTAGVTGALKSTTNRERPSGGDYSFPSGHTSNAFTNVALANRNLQYITMSDNLRFALEVSNWLLASATGWARIEADAHWLTDVFAGAAVGYFFGTFLHDGFMGLPEENPARVQVVPLRGGAMLALSFHF